MRHRHVDELTMRNTGGFARTPSVLGGYRPQVRDERRDQFQRVQYMRGDVQRATEKLAKMQEDLAKEEEVLDNMRESCAHCGACSACVGG